MRGHGRIMRRLVGSCPEQTLEVCRRKSRERVVVTRLPFFGPAALDGLAIGPPPAPSPRRVAIYISRPDSPLAANQLAAIQRYACAMGWVTVAIVESDEQRLLELAATHALDLVLCWRTSDLRAAESLIQLLSAHSIELLAVAQSCTSLIE